MKTGTVVENYWEINEPWIGTAAQADRKNVYLRAQYRTLPGSAGLVSAVQFDYDKNGNLTSKKEFGWPMTVPRITGVVSGVPGGTPLRTTTTSYFKPTAAATTGMPATFDQTEADAYWNNYSVKVKGEVNRTTIADSTGTVAVTGYVYDDAGAGTTANVTSEAHWDNTRSVSVPATLDRSNSAVWDRIWDPTVPTKGNLIQETDPDGHVTKYDYASNGVCTPTYVNLYPTKITQAQGLTEQRTTLICYDYPSGVATQSVDFENSLTTTYDYDTYARRKKTTEIVSETLDPNTHAVLTTVPRYTDRIYDDTARQVQVISDRASGGARMATIYDFDQFGRIWQRRSNDDSGGAVTTAGTGVRMRSGERINGVYRYTVGSTAGRSPAGATTAGWTRKAFDGEGRLIEEATFTGDTMPAPWGTNTSSMGTTTLAYADETTTVTDASGRTKTSAVDPLGRLASVDEGGVSNATYAYTALDSLTGVTQTDSSSYTGTVTQSRTFLYTSLNRLKSATNPESGTTSYTYYAGGSLNTKVDARPVTTTYGIDGLKRVTSKSYNDGKTPAVSYCYDGKMYASGVCASVTRVAPDFPMGRLTGYGSQVDGADAGRNYSRIDGLGRVLESRQRSAGSASGEYVFQYGYQLDGALTQVNYPSGRVVTYTTSDRSLPLGLTTASGAVSGALYEPDGQLKSATIGPFSQTWAHNSRGQMTETTATGSGSVKLFAMTLDYGTTANNGNVWAETVNPDNVAATLQYFRYDNANRLRLAAENPSNPSLVDTPSATCAQIGGTWCHRYGFDVFGNAWQADLTGTAPGLKANGPAWYLQGTAVSNRMTGQLYDNAGNLQQYEADTAKRAEYDGEGRVTKTTDVISGSTVTTGENWYDGEGLRVKKRVSGVTTWFARGADGEVMAEYQVGGAATSSGVQYLVSDHLGSTRVLVAGDGSVAGRLNYTPFGTELGTASGLTARKFTGKERDAETGLDYFGARYFSGAQGRFTSPDTGPFILYEPQSFNLYSYALNSPLRYGDDDGLTAKDRVNAANSFAAQGIDYAIGGGHPGNRNESCGLDCSGLVYKVFKADPDNTLRIGGNAASEDAAIRSGGEYSTDIRAAQPGDAIFWSDSSGHVVHTGIVVDIRDGKVYFVHAPKPGAKVNRFWVKVASPNLGNELFVGVGRSIESQRHQTATPVNNRTMWQSAVQWWNSWSFFGPSPQTPQRVDPEGDPQKKRKGKKLVPRGPRNDNE